MPSPHSKLHQLLRANHFHEVIVASIVISEVNLEIKCLRSPAITLQVVEVALKIKTSGASQRSFLVVNRVQFCKNYVVLVKYFI